MGALKVERERSEQINEKRLLCLRAANLRFCLGTIVTNFSLPDDTFDGTFSVSVALLLKIANLLKMEVEQRECSVFTLESIVFGLTTYGLSRFAS